MKMPLLSTYSQILIACLVLIFSHSVSAKCVLTQTDSLTIYQDASAVIDGFKKLFNNLAQSNYSISEKEQMIDNAIQYKLFDSPQVRLHDDLLPNPAILNFQVAEAYLKSIYTEFDLDSQVQLDYGSVTCASHGTPTICFSPLYATDQTGNVSDTFMVAKVERILNGKYNGRNGHRYQNHKITRYIEFKVSTNPKNQRWKVRILNIQSTPNEPEKKGIAPLLFYPDCIPPLSPKLTRVSTNTANISWEHCDNQPDFEVHYRALNSSPLFIKVPVQETSYTFVELQAKTTYEYKIVNICGDASSATPLDTFTTVEPSCQCSNETVASIHASHKSASVNWKAQTGVKNYSVYYRQNNDETITYPWQAVQYDGESPTFSFRTINGLTPNTNYELRIDCTCTDLGNNQSDYKRFKTKK